MARIPLESDLMRGFLAVAETGSVTIAAARLGRTQSAVSLLIKRLEENLGQPLFERLARGVRLTPRGEQLLPYALRVTSLLDEAALALREKPLIGPVRVGIPDEYSSSILPRALAAFDERHEGLQVSVICDHAERQLEALEEDRLDLAVIHDTSYFLEGELLGVDPAVWVTSTLHNQHLRSPVPVALYRDSGWCRDFAQPSLTHQGIRWREAWRSDMASSLVNAVLNGMAIAPLSRSTIPAGCRPLSAEDGFPEIDSARVLLRRNPRGGSPAINGMAEVLREAFRPLARSGAEAAGEGEALSLASAPQGQG